MVIISLTWLALWVVAVPLALGWSPVAVTSGSMAPRIASGDIVIVTPFEGQKLVPGTVIVFENAATQGRVTHRIVDIDGNGDYITRGDANVSNDSTPVASEHIVGVGRLLVPMVGQPFVWAENSQWLLLVVAAALVGLALWVSRWALMARYDPWDPSAAGRRQSDDTGQTSRGRDTAPGRRRYAAPSKIS